MTPSAREKRLVSDLESIVGGRNITDDPSVCRSYETDWMGRHLGRSRAVVRPATTEETAAVLKTCTRAGVSVVPQGGNTGLVGGGVPRGGEVLLSTRRMNWVGNVDLGAKHLHSGAGATLTEARLAALECGQDLGIDLASRNSATVGGLVATNAGGLRTLRYGHTRSQLVGLEAVLPDGRVLRRLNGLRKDTAGYDLTGLLCGSEGTLGVITSAILRIFPSPTSTVTALIGVSSIESALEVLSFLQARGIPMNSAEIMFADGVEKVRELFGVVSPLGLEVECQVLLEASSMESGDVLLESFGNAICERTDVVSSAVGADPSERGALWKIREYHPEVVGRLGIPRKLDISVPLQQLPKFEWQVRELLAGYGVEFVLYGHVGDGNLHVNFAAPETGGTEIEESVCVLTAQLGGSISAEHGIGTDKVAWLHYSKSDVEVSLFRTIKNALDPTDLLNPGVLLSTNLAT